MPPPPSSGAPTLSPNARAQLEVVLGLLATDPRSLTSVRDPQAAWRAHVADSAAGLEIPALREAGQIADLGSGAGFPGLVIAVMRPEATVTMIESVTRKCAFIREAATAAEIPNALVVDARSEDHAKASGKEAYDVVTARAVGRLATLAELASPLLLDGGCLIAWKGKRDSDEEAELDRAGEGTAMALTAVHAPADTGYEHRHLYVVAKTGDTPADLPRRPGVAKKRPFGALT